MPKLLQINVCNNVYSSGKIAGAIGDLVADRGWESYIAYPKDYAESKSVPIQIGNWIDWCINGIEQRLFDNTGFGFGSFFPTRYLIKRIKDIKPDIIHLHVIVGYYLHYKELFNYLATLDIPVVWTLHDCWEVTGHCCHFDYEGCEKWKSGCYDCALKNEYPQSYLFDRSKKNYLLKRQLFNSIKDLHLVAVSKWLGDVYAQSFLKDKPLEVIYNGVDIKKFYPSADVREVSEKYNLKGKFVAVGVSTSWVPKKGVKDYYQLAHLLSDDIVIIMVGVPSSMKSSVPSNIICIEKTTSVKELRDIYSIADVVLNLSYEETFGLTTVEGFACGTPSIVYNRTASPELVSKETGYVVKAGDVNQVYSCIREIKAKGKQSYSNACVQRAKTLFDKDKNYISYINLYERLIHK